MGGNGLVIRSIDAGQNWSSSTPTGVTLNAVHFVSDEIGWAVGNAGVVLKTTNGGTDWSQASPGTLNLNDVFFVDANRGWVVGDAGKILHTTNGGSNWTTSTPTAAALHGVFFASPSEGWAVGNAVVLHTTNAGVNWLTGAPTVATLQDVHFVASTGWAVGSNGVVLKSINSGVSWSSSSPTTHDLNSVFFTNDMAGWAVGEAGTVLKTINGGGNWTEQHPVATALESVFFVDDLTGWAVGASGVVLKTIDGGENWDATSPASVTLNGVFFASIPTQVSVTVRTSPAGRSFSVDGVVYASSHTFASEPGAPHTIATTSPQSGATGTQYVWANWSHGGAMSQTVSPAADVTYTANFTTQHYLTMPPAANGTTSPDGGWHDAGSQVEITATPDPGYGFNGWTGTGTGSYTGWANPATVAMNGPVTEAAAFGTDVTVVVQCTPAGRSFTVDGTTYSSTQSFTWVPGSSHTIDAASPQDVGADTRYVFTRWSDSGSQNHSIAPVSNTTYSATFKTQYTLTMIAGAGGTVTPAGGWQDAATVVAITATPDSGYSFQSWTGTGSGSYNGSANPKTVSINGPVTQQASFRVGTAPAFPEALTLLANVPNPFANGTDLRFGLPRDADVQVDVFDVKGRRVFRDVVPGVPAGWQSYRLDSHGAAQLRSGVYFVKITAAGVARTGRIVVLR